MKTESSSSEIIYKWYPLTDEQLAEIRKTFTPDQVKLLHNMRTETVNMRLNLQSDSEGFKKMWDQSAGSLNTLTTLIGDADEAV